MHQWLQGRENSYYWMGIRAFVQRWKKNLSSDRDHIGNTCAFSNVVLIFYGKILRYQTYK
jgi:hypothetical protein